MTLTETRNCPSSETLAAFMEGRSEPGELNAVVEHLQSCARCRLTVEDVSEAEQVEASEDVSEAEQVEASEDVSEAEQVEAPDSETRIEARIDNRSHRKALRRWLPLAAAIVVVPSIVTIFRKPVPEQQVSPIQNLVAASPSTWRPTAGRITGGFPWAPLQDPDRGDSQPAVEKMIMDGAAGKVLAERQAGTDAESLHLTGIGSKTAVMPICRWHWPLRIVPLKRRRVPTRRSSIGR
jgi:hypothetical protein